MLALLVVLKLTVLRRMPYFWPLCVWGAGGPMSSCWQGCASGVTCPKASCMRRWPACSSLALDLLTGWRGWSLNFVLPILGGGLESFFFAPVCIGAGKTIQRLRYLLLPVLPVGGDGTDSGADRRYHSVAAHFGGPPCWQPF